MIILKTDLKIAYIQHEIYHLIYRKQIQICAQKKLIYSPVFIYLDMEYLYGILSNSGYNLFDSTIFIMIYAQYE